MNRKIKIYITIQHKCELCDFTFSDESVNNFIPFVNFPKCFVKEFLKISHYCPIDGQAFQNCGFFIGTLIQEPIVLGPKIYITQIIATYFTKRFDIFDRLWKQITIILMIYLVCFVLKLMSFFETSYAHNQESFCLFVKAYFPKKKEPQNSQNFQKN